MRHRPSCCRRREGFTLLEMLVVMWGLTVALTLGVTLLVVAMRADRVGAATLHKVVWRAELADQFRTDVARTVTAPDGLGNLTRGPHCLILRLHDGAYVIYQWQDERLERIVRAGHNETRRPLPAGAHDVSVEFDRTEGDRPLIILRLVESPARGVVWRTEVSAALGGDLR